MKFPYFPFYVNDFSADAKVEGMAAIEVGAYILLLCKAWNEDPPGTLPNDDRILARLSRLFALWEDHKIYVMGPFNLGEDGRWHQRRMEAEHLKLEGKYEKQSLGAQKTNAKRAAKRAGKRNESDTQSESESESVPPISPKGDLFGEYKKWNPSADMLRLGSLFKRMSKTVWSKNEIKALKAIGKIDHHDLELLETYYREKIPTATNYRRKDLQTLLNNFNGEVDRARNHKPHKPF